mmetsp:Transcript_118080/g.341386  ORF Transcript_118080/g.341386 Transcript_118080/m.341386 type:complete len:249 (+) Transcript_118080:1993-2739(+)
MDHVLDIRGYTKHVLEQLHAGMGGGLEDCRELIYGCEAVLVRLALDGDPPNLIQQSLLLLRQRRGLPFLPAEHEVQQLQRKLPSGHRQAAQVVQQGAPRVVVRPAEPQHVLRGVLLLCADGAQQGRLLEDRVRQCHVAAMLSEQPRDVSPTIEHRVVEASAAKAVRHIRVGAALEQQLADIAMPLSGRVEQWRIVRHPVVRDHGLDGGTCIEKQGRRLHSTPRRCKVERGACVPLLPLQVMGTGVDIR